MYIYHFFFRRGFWVSCLVDGLVVWGFSWCNVNFLILILCRASSWEACDKLVGELWTPAPCCPWCAQISDADQWRGTILCVCVCMCECGGSSTWYQEHINIYVYFGYTPVWLHMVFKLHTTTFKLCGMSLLTMTNRGLGRMLVVLQLVIMVVNQVQLLFRVVEDSRAVVHASSLILCRKAGPSWGIVLCWCMLSSSSPDGGALWPSHWSPPPRHWETDGV